MVQLSGVETNGIDSIDVGEGDYVAALGNTYFELPNTEGIYQDIDDAVAEMYECMETPAAANPLGNVEGIGCGETCNLPSPASDVDTAIDMYEHAVSNGGAAINLPCMGDGATYIGTYI